MRKIVLGLFVAGALLAAGVLAQAKGEAVVRPPVIWQAVNDGLASLDVKAVAVHPVTPTIVLADTVAGTYRSVDRGDSWSKVRDHSGLYTYMHEVAWADEESVYLCDWSDGFYRSDDVGQTWTQRTSGLPVSAGCRGIAVDGTSPLTVYLALRNDASMRFGLYRSADGGESWTATSLTGVPCHDVAVASSDPSRIYVATWDDVWVSSDWGTTWLTSSFGTAVEVVTVDAGNPDRAYIGTWGSGLRRTVDGGQTWQGVSGVSGELVGAVLADPTTPGVAYAGTSAGVFRTLDGGATWSEENLGLTVGGVIRALALDVTDPGVLYAGSDATTPTAGPASFGRECCRFSYRS